MRLACGGRAGCEALCHLLPRGPKVKTAVPNLRLRGLISESRTYVTLWHNPPCVLYGSPGVYAIYRRNQTLISESG